MFGDFKGGEGSGLLFLVFIELTNFSKNCHLLYFTYNIFFFSHLKMTLTFLNSKIPFWELKKGSRPVTIIYENICKNEAYFLNPLKIIFAHNDDLLKHEGSTWYFKYA